MIWYSMVSGFLWTKIEAVQRLCQLEQVANVPEFIDDCSGFINQIAHKVTHYFCNERYYILLMEEGCVLMSLQRVRPVYIAPNSHGHLM